MNSLRPAVWFVLATIALTGCDPSHMPAGPATAPPSGSTAPSDATSGSAAPSASPTATPVPARQVSISDASTGRLLQSSDAPYPKGRRVLVAAEMTASVLPCARTNPASDAQVVDRNGVDMSFTFLPNSGYSNVYEVLTLYRQGGAAQYMSELTAALAACPADQTVSYAVEASNFAGDESVLIRAGDAPTSNPQIPSITSWYRVVVRADDVVMVLTVTPWSGSVGREIVDTILDIAINRARD